jgi:uncharacterized protein (TIGR02246 family)
MFAALPVLLIAGCTAKNDAAATQTADSPATVAPSSTGDADPSAVRRAIDSANAQVVNALKQGDAAATAAVYADDAISMPPDQPALRGRDAIRKSMEKFLSGTTVKNPTLTTVDVIVSGDIAVETGTQDGTMQPKSGGGAVSAKGKYLAVYKRQPDGSWKIIRDAYNPDAPTPK